MDQDQGQTRLSALDNPHLSCKCVGKHIPKPMELHKHHVWPLGEGGPDTRENLLILCPTTHANVHRLWRLYNTYKGRPPWEILKNYSEYVRAIVERGRELKRAHNASVRESISSAPSGVGTLSNA